MSAESVALLNEDIARLKQENGLLRSALTRVHEKLQIAMESAEFDFWENNFVTGEISDTGRIFTRLGYGEESEYFQIAKRFELVHPDDMESVLNAIDGHFSGQIEHYRCEFRLKARDGQWIWMANFGRVVERDNDGQVVRFVGITYDIQDRKEKEEQLHQLAAYDELTGLYNRRSSFAILEKELELCAACQKPLSVCFLDMDGFKKINDRFGHQAGDVQLVALAKMMGQAVRSSDFLCRVGGDEFLIIFPGSGEEVAQHSLNRLETLIDQYNQNGSDGYPLSVSYGIETVDKGRLPEVRVLLEQADARMYLQKKSKKMGVIL